MAELGYYDADLHDAIVQLTDLVDQLATAPRGVRPEVTTPATRRSLPTKNMLARATVTFQDVTALTNAFQVALRQAPRDQVRAYRETFHAHCVRVDALARDLEWAKAEHERRGLFGTPHATSTLPCARRGPHDVVGLKKVLEKTVDVQSKTEQSLTTTATMVNESKAMAAATAQALHRQRDHLVEITDAVTKVETRLERADKWMRAFAWRMATDRVLRLCTLWVMLGLAAIVAYKAVHPNETIVDVPDEIPRPAPTAR
ncbi:hypothetical protein PsorP6_012607 [Peronosclerospora sorghi]|uniref:Uncharacterized protein n=1 Tax=Peronosclerospora sorghi TaxID=230839 RepID=A0ACC0WHF9_9STRA|nr:hypothetical protein PsorP6_012607 [Peronosclerospora sorghi]